MTVNPIGGPLFRPDKPGGLGSDDGDQGDHGHVREVDASPRSDRVELSNEGRALAADEGESELNAARLLEVQNRIDEGFYDRPEVVEETARRILLSGDLHGER